MFGTIPRLCHNVWGSCNRTPAFHRRIWTSSGWFAHKIRLNHQGSTSFKTCAMFAIFGPFWTIFQPLLVVGYWWLELLIGSRGGVMPDCRGGDMGLFWVFFGVQSRQDLREVFWGHFSWWISISAGFEKLAFLDRFFSRCFRPTRCIFLGSRSCQSYRNYF